MLGSVPVTEIIFMRHGETAWNKDHRIQGREDIPLNDTGRQQVRDAAAKLRDLIADTPGTFPLPTPVALEADNSVVKDPTNLGIHAILTSPLCRAVESARILAREIHFPEDNIVVEPELTEWNAGSLQGHLFTELPDLFPAAWKAWRLERDPHFVFPGGESFAHRQARVTEAVQRLAQVYSGKRIVVVCHAGVLDDIYRRAKHIPLQNMTRLPKLNAGFHIIHIECKPAEGKHFPKWSILRWGLKKIPYRGASFDLDMHPVVASERDSSSSQQDKVAPSDPSASEVQRPKQQTYDPMSIVFA